MIYALIAAAIAIFLWPSSSKTVSKTPNPFDLAVEQKKSPSFQSSLVALSLVRGRLIATEKLGDQERAAIESLTLSLVDGSDKD